MAKYNGMNPMSSIQTKTDHDHQDEERVNNTHEATCSLSLSSDHHVPSPSNSFSVPSTNERVSCAQTKETKIQRGDSGYFSPGLSNTQNGKFALPATVEYAENAGDQTTDFTKDNLQIQLCEGHEENVTYIDEPATDFNNEFSAMNVDEKEDENPYAQDMRDSEAQHQEPDLHCPATLNAALGVGSNGENNIMHAQECLTEKHAKANPWNSDSGMHNTTTRKRRHESSSDGISLNSSSYESSRRRVELDDCNSSSLHTASRRNRRKRSVPFNSSRPDLDFSTAISVVLPWPVMTDTVDYVRCWEAALNEPPKEQNFADASTRKVTFNVDMCLDHLSRRKEEFVLEGFFFTGVGDIVRCYQCGVMLREWTEEVKVSLAHIRFSPLCKTLITLIRPQL